MEKTGIIDKVRATIKAFASGNIKQPLSEQSGVTTSFSDVIQWYQNSRNLFPDDLTDHYLRSSIFSPIVQELVSFFTGRGFESSDASVKALIESANRKESLRTVFKGALTNWTLTGNAFIMMAFDVSGTWILLNNVHAINCRLSNRNSVFYRDSWKTYSGEVAEVETLIFPAVTKRKGVMYSFLHIKDDVPGFPNYAPPYWIAGKENSSIPELVTNWNSKRIKSGFSVAGFIQDPAVDGDDAATQAAIDTINEAYSGEDGVGKMMFVQAGGKITMLDKLFDMDWTVFKKDAKSTLHTDMRFPASLMGDYGEKGFSKDKGQTDYNLFKPFMEDAQQLNLEPIAKAVNEITGWDTSDLKVNNINPFQDERKEL